MTPPVRGVKAHSQEKGKKPANQHQNRAFLTLFPKSPLDCRADVA
jgi:hypothetical protein